MHGQFCWYELSTPDVEASKKFYARFTGWGTQAFDANYNMFTTGGVPIAGIFKLNDQMRSNGVPPNWMAYVESDNVDDTVAKAKSLGAKVVAPAADIPGTGRYAVLQDPQGATFGVYRSSRQSGGWDGKNVVGRFSWHELMTTDYQKAFDFYSSLFGWNRTSAMDMGGGNMYQMYPPFVDTPHEIDWLSGACQLVRREVFEQVGPFDEGYFLYFEELDFARRARARGVRCWHVPHSRVVHLVGQSTGLGARHGPQARMPPYWFASRRRYYLKHHGRLYKFVADVAFAAGKCVWHTLRVIRGRRDEGPPRLLRDFVRHNFWFGKGAGRT
jgi:predicted enzyme related to lactoylglutathione lyase